MRVTKKKKKNIKKLLIRVTGELIQAAVLQAVLDDDVSDRIKHELQPTNYIEGLM